MKRRIREMAEELIKVAAAREIRAASVFSMPDGAYNEFVTRFPYEETDDQLASIDAVTEDLAKGRPMDRFDLRRRRLRQDGSGRFGRLSSR